MTEVLFGRGMQKLVAVFGIYWILATLDLSWEDSRWWGVAILLFVVDYLSSIDGEHRGITRMLNLEREQLLKLKDFMDAVDRGETTSLEELDKIMKKDDKNE